MVPNCYLQYVDIKSNTFFLEILVLTFVLMNQIVRDTTI